MIIAGGGVQYSRAVAVLNGFAEAHQMPVVENIAGRDGMVATHPLNIGPIGVTPSTCANAIAEQSDVIVAVGTSLSGLRHRFVDGIFQRGAFHIDQRRAPRFKQTHVLVGLWGMPSCYLRHWGRVSKTMLAQAPLGCMSAKGHNADWDAYVAENVASGNSPNSYAMAIGVVNDLCDKR